MQFALRWGRNWAAQWHLARAVGKRFRGCRAKRLYVQRGRAAEARLLHVLTGLTRTPQVEEEVGDDLAQHPDVHLGEVAVAEHLGVRGEHALARPRGAARTPRCGVWARWHHAAMTFMNELWVAVVPPQVF